MRNDESVLWKADEPHFATAFLASGEFIYLYGTVKRGDTHQAYVARVIRTEIERIQNYEYLNSPSMTWSRDLADATPVFDGMPSEMSASWNEHLQSYLAVHSLDLSGNIVARTAPNPWGPWSKPAVVWTVHSKRQSDLPYPILIYAGKEHPELAGDGGRKIYLTYIEFEEYFPHLIEVTLG